MIVLGIETTTRVGSVALAMGNKVVEKTLLGEMNHSEQLLPALDNLLKSQQVTFDDIQRVAVSIGPGSFTGIRIGVTVAKVLGQISGEKTVAVPTLDAIAFSVKEQQGIICPLINAIGGEMYYAFYEQGTPIKRMTPYAVSDVKALCAAASKFRKKILFLGEGLIPRQSYIQEVLKEKALFAESGTWMPRAGIIARLAVSIPPVHWSKLAPEYIRPSEAERMWKKR